MKFDYNEAIAELEKIAARVEDPACREYLRTARQTTETL